MYAPKDREEHAIMRAKTWGVDGKTFVGGSPNFTSNGLERSEEMMVIIESEEVMTNYLEWFKSLWRVSKELPPARR